MHANTLRLTPLAIAALAALLLATSAPAAEGPTDPPDPPCNTCPEHDCWPCEGSAPWEQKIHATWRYPPPNDTVLHGQWNPTGNISGAPFPNGILTVEFPSRMPREFDGQLPNDQENKSYTGVVGPLNDQDACVRASDGAWIEGSSKIVESEIDYQYEWRGAGVTLNPLVGWNLSSAPAIFQLGPLQEYQDFGQIELTVADHLKCGDVIHQMPENHAVHHDGNAVIANTVVGFRPEFYSPALLVDRMECWGASGACPGGSGVLVTHHPSQRLMKPPFYPNLVGYDGYSSWTFSWKEVGSESTASCGQAGQSIAITTGEAIASGLGVSLTFPPIKGITAAVDWRASASMVSSVTTSVQAAALTGLSRHAKRLQLRVKVVHNYNASWTSCTFCAYCICTHHWTDTSEDDWDFFGVKTTNTSCGTAL